MEKNNAFKDENLLQNEHQEVFESFVCCVCLDLLYKPIVLSCGHISCFWCVHKSMNGLRESHCPICRHPYYHFPTICQMLHFLLLKIYPLAYKRREKQILEEEEKTGLFSPQFDAYMYGSQVIFDHPGSSPSCTITNPVSNSCSVKSFECTELSGSATHIGDEGTINSEHTSDKIPEVIGTPVEGKTLIQNEHNQQPKLLVTDLMCTMCKKLLFHPVVLNCGHVYCESCIIDLPDEMLRCQVCQSPHPTGFPKVCLALDHFLEEQFPEEYARRRDSIQLIQIKVKPETTSSGSLGEMIAWCSDPGLAIHVGVGCDFCGMYPITGDRYRCVECKEKIGFDLCSDCYKTRSKLPGRFNQQHTPEHKFRLEQSYGTFRGQLNGQGSSENLVIIADDPVSPDDGEDNQSNSEATN
ncbi:Zinc finger, ZZ-type [Sesbania bispinosa]|nr:Zinc finger, ZZ-type [Sesbania bispinosa]